MKQRLIGAAVVTALAAIFIPMLFEDPVDNNGQAVSEMTVPETPANPKNGPDSKLPNDAADIDNANATIQDLTSGRKSTAQETQDQGLDYEPPSEVEGESDNGIAPDGGNPAEEPIDEAPNGEALNQDLEAPSATPMLDEEPPADAAPNSLPRVPVKPPVQSRAPKPKPIARPRVETEPRYAQPAPAPINIPDDEPAPAPAPAPKASGKLGRWHLQAGSYSKKENAVSQYEALRKQGIPVVIEPQSTGGGTIYRLRIGPELSKQRALDMKNRLSQLKIKSIIIAE